MNDRNSRFSRRAVSLPALVVGLGLLWCGSAGAQVNLLQNGDFDTAPLGPTNWTILYLHGGPDSWEIKGRTTPSTVHNNGIGTGSMYDGTFRPIDQKLAHACFTQTVTNLTTNRVYQLVGHMRQDWWKGTGVDTNGAPNNLTGKYRVYIEVIGGQGAPTQDGRASVFATNNLTYCTGHNYDPETNIDPPYAYATIIWRPFYANQTPDAKGKIEVRLHYNMVGGVEWDKCFLMAAYFDAISLTY
jgi:hypothetical protein